MNTTGLRMFHIQFPQLLKYMYRSYIGYYHIFLFGKLIYSCLFILYLFILYFLSIVSAVSVKSVRKTVGLQSNLEFACPIHIKIDVSNKNNRLLFCYPWCTYNL